MTPKEESEKLVNALLPVAVAMLKRYGEFYPYGGYIRPNGAIVHVGASDPDTDRPTSRDLLFILQTSFGEIARTSEYSAVAVVFQVDVTIPGSNHKSDAVQFCVEHSAGYSVEIFFPYELAEGEVIYGDTFAQQGRRDVFASN
jgi:hypothetical protein